jgi:chromosome partitioning protein
MRTILVTNAKGGCGKSTLATNLAAYYASKGYRVALADYDPQASSLDWLAERPAQLPVIDGIAAYESGLTHLPRSADFLIVDAPARSHGHELTVLLRKAESILVPVLPSPIDIKAAARFIRELLGTRKIRDHKARVALVANRVKENTLIFEELDEFLSHFRIPYVAYLRDAQNYVRSYQRGVGIHELPEYLAWPDWEQWDPLIEWLESRRSRPRASA